MGGAIQTTNIIIINAKSGSAPTKSFTTTLLTWLNNLVSGSPYTITNDSGKDAPTLQTAVLSLSTQYFLNQYLYAFNGPNTVPPTSDLAVMVDLNDWCNVAQNSIESINVYINTTVFPASSLVPVWCQRRMRADLATYLQSLLMSPINVGFKTVPYTRYYHDPAGKSDMRVDAQLLYTLIPALDHNNEPVMTMFVGFVGCAYSVLAGSFVVKPPQAQPISTIGD